MPYYSTAQLGKPDPEVESKSAPGGLHHAVWELFKIQQPLKPYSSLCFCYPRSPHTQSQSISSTIPVLHVILLKDKGNSVAWRAGVGFTAHRNNASSALELSPLQARRSHTLPHSNNTIPNLLPFLDLTHKMTKKSSIIQIPQSFAPEGLWDMVSHRMIFSHFVVHGPEKVANWRYRVY